jgi:hypothetical protein
MKGNKMKKIFVLMSGLIIGLILYNGAGVITAEMSIPDRILTDINYTTADFQFINNQNGTVLMQEDIPEPPGMVWIGYITPLIIMGVTWLVRKVKPKLSGWTIVWLIVPALAALLSFITTQLDLTTFGFWMQSVWNLLAIVITELIKQLNQGNDQSPNYNARLSSK